MATKNIYPILSYALNKKDEKTRELIFSFFEDTKALLSVEDKDIVSFFINYIKRTSKFPSLLEIQKERPELYDIFIEYQEDIPDDSDELEANIKDYSWLLKNQRLSSKIATIAGSLINKANSGVVDEDLLAETINSLQQLRNEQTRKAFDVNKFSVENMMSLLEERKTQQAGLITGFKVIDDVIGSIKPGNVFIIGGYAGDGKTTTALNMFHRNVYVEAFNCVYFSLEMSALEILINLMTRHSMYLCEQDPDIFMKRRIRPLLSNELNVRNPRDISPDYWDVFKEVYTDFVNNSRGKFWIFEEESFPKNVFSEYKDALDTVDEEWLKQGTRGLDCAFWDHANLFKFSSATTKKNQQVGEAINDFLSNIRSIGHNFKKDSNGNQRYLTNIVLMQLNREARKKALNSGCGYTLDALAEANESERCAAYVLTTYSDNDTKAQGEAQLQLLKHRFGKTILEPERIKADLDHYTLKDVTNSSEQYKQAINHVNAVDLGISDNDFDSAVDDVIKSDPWS